MRRTSILCFTCLALLAAPLFAQPVPPAAPAPPKAMRGGGRGMEGGGMGIVPPGTWWKSPDVITALALTADQQKKLDDMFLQSRITLIHLHASLEEEQLKLEPLLNVNPPAQAKAMAQVARIADLRADLEKADAKMLLGLRGVLTADQWTKLQAQQRMRHDKDHMDNGQDRESYHGPKRQPGPQGQQGPHGPNGPQNGPPPPASPESE